MKRNIISALLFTFIAVAAIAADPTAISYSWDNCQGTYKPYPAPTTQVVVPDSLTPVMINHLGRHGARFPASERSTKHIHKMLRHMDEHCGGLTPTGKQLLDLSEKVMAIAAGRWGSLSQLGQMEQRAIASRMYTAFKPLFAAGRVQAISSYSPRCIMSMYEFAHQLSRLDNNVDINTSSGRCNSPLLRFFDDSPAFKAFLDSEALQGVATNFENQAITIAPLKRLAKGDVTTEFDEEELHRGVMDEFSLLTSLQAFGMTCKPTDYLTPEEQNALWSISNINHYLRRSDSVLSAIPADIAAPLLENFITTFDKYVADPASVAPVQLRFGHAETIIPMLALLHIPGCYYLTNYFDTVALHWRDFYISPMAANLQMVLLRNKKGKLYLLTLLNEVPVPLIPGNNAIYVPWTEARTYLEKCLPFDYM